MAERNTKISKVDAIYGLILDKIQSRELLPGDRLNIEDLARDFGVSRTPVRETVNRLIQEGFVEQKHNVGPSVDVYKRQLYQLRVRRFRKFSRRNQSDHIKACLRRRKSFGRGGADRPCDPGNSWIRG